MKSYKHSRPFYTGLIIFSLTFSYPSLGKKNKLLLCLAREETQFHQKKITSPDYQLNQLYLNELASTGNIELKNRYYEIICSGKKAHPATGLMRHMLIFGSSIFKINISIQNVALHALHKATLEAMDKRTPHIFFSYLSQLQSKASTHDCFTKRVPHLSYFLERFKYLESEISVKRLIREKDKINEMFSAMLNSEEILKQCRRESKREED